MVMSSVRQVWPKSILQGSVKGGRRQGRQRKRWEDNIWEWTGLEFGKSQRAVENREKMEETGCEIICGAPTTLVVKGQMIMMMVMMMMMMRGHPGGWATPLSAEEMLDGEHQRVNILHNARTAHKGLLQNKLEEDFC